MPLKRVKSKRKQNKLTDDQYWNLMLEDEFDPFLRNGERIFETEENRKKAWFIHREELLQEVREDKMAGTRPGAWWQYESKIGHYPDRDGITEEKYLRDNNLLLEWELEELKKRKK